jgi:hypothetical protein
VGACRDHHVGRQQIKHRAVLGFRSTAVFSCFLEPAVMSAPPVRYRRDIEQEMVADPERHFIFRPSRWWPLLLDIVPRTAQVVGAGQKGHRCTAFRYQFCR